MPPNDRRLRFGSAVQGDFHIDALATDLLIGYRPRGFIGDQLFPVIPVQKESNAFARINRDNWFRIDDTIRAPRTRAKQVSWTVTSDNYRVSNYALETVVEWETLANADPPHRPAEQAGMFLTDKLMLAFEDRVVTTCLSGVGSSAALSGTAAWNDYANSDPLKDLDVAVNAIMDTTGMPPNTLILGRKCWQKLRRHPDVIRAVFPGAGVGGIASPEQFGGILPVPGVRILIGETIKNTADETAVPGGIDSGTFTDVWSTFCLLMHVAPAPGILVPTFGVAFRWTNPELGPGLSAPPNFAIERKSDDDIRADIFRTGYYQAEKIVAPELGYLVLTGI